MVQAGHSYARKWEEEAYIPVTPGVNYQPQVRGAYRKPNIGRSLVIKTILFLFAYALLLVYLCIKSSTLGYQIVSLENGIASLETANHSLECSIAQQTSLKRIEMIATRDLGMHRSDTTATVCMNVPNLVKVADNNTATQAAQAQNGTLQNIYKNLRRLAIKN
ncbi:MAG: hypothetical protein ACM3PE_05940 [Deltaproteobacteria bacterium]